MEPSRRRRRLAVAAASSAVAQAVLLVCLNPSISSPSLASPLLLHLLSISSSSLLIPLKQVKRKRQLDDSTLAFNMSSSTFEWLTGLLEPLLDCPSLSTGTCLAISLSRLTTGEPYSSLSTRFGLPDSTVRLCVRRFCRVILTNYRFWLSFPSSPTDLNSISSHFESLTDNRIPNCCGALTCVRFKTGSGSIAAQIVADCSFRILHLAAGFRGERSDFDVLKNSSLYDDMNEGKLFSADKFLIGAGNYPLLPWLMVPFDQTKEKEEGFNAVHKTMQSPLGRVVSSLNNWGVLLNLEEETDNKMVLACVSTCAMLHNALLMREDLSALSEEEREIGGETGDGYERCDDDVASFEVEGKAVEMRNELAERVWVAKRVR
ncbi:hypothetical protein LUZ60_000838 [Juncus effusus]|nr:hypothetical protein LUZ60_000838 [Juncus effusus]